MASFYKTRELMKLSNIVANFKLNKTLVITPRWSCLIHSMTSPHIPPKDTSRVGPSCVPHRMFLSDNKYSSSYQGNFIAKFSEEIDIDELREKKIREKQQSGENINVTEVLKEILTEKCDEAIANLDDIDKKKLKIIQLEHDFLFSEGYAIPSPEDMTSENWLEAMNLSSKQRRLRYYIFWEKKRLRKENAKKKKAMKPKSPVLEPTDRKEIPVNRIFMRIYDSTMKRWLNHGLAASMRFGIPLVLDMDYGDFMANREIKNTAKQLVDVYCMNRNDEQLPFHLHFTGCSDSNPIYRTLQLYMQDDPHFMATVTPQSYLDCFEKDRLIYLSPHGKQILQEFDPEAVYIVGAFNDKSTQKPVSYARAKKQSIKCQRLPLDIYLRWSLGSKSLTLDQIMAILMAVKNKKSWPKALKAVPSRKFINPNDQH